MLMALPIVSTVCEARDRKGESYKMLYAIVIIGRKETWNVVHVPFLPFVTPFILVGFLGSKHYHNLIFSIFFNTAH